MEPSHEETVSNSIPEEATAAISASHLLHTADIGNDEKRAILASWSSDIFAIESIPALRLCPGTDKAVSYDEIIEALKSLGKHDQQSRVADSTCRPQAVLAARLRKFVG